jgi:tetratricopeptide (TPR) repeat protein
MVSLARAYNNLESWKEALEILRQVDSMFPNDYEVLKGKARSLMKLGQTQELEETYLLMRKLDPEDHTILMYLGQICFKKGQTTQGLEYYRKAVEMEPESFMAWKILLEALERLGLKEEARDARAKYKEIEEKLRKSGTRIIPKF